MLLFNEAERATFAYLQRVHVASTTGFTNKK